MVTSALRIAALAVLLATSAVHGQDGEDESEVLECYTCTMSGDNDDTCFSDPDNSGATPITECKLGAGQCCIISRTDSTDDPGTPLSMFRGCIEDCDPDLIGELVTTETFSTTTYESYCDEDRCNNGPGDTKPGQDEVLECYTCTMSGSTNDSCFTDPDNAGSQPTTECELGAGQCCIISRTDSTDDPGTPVTMYRGCLQDCDPDLIGALVTISSDTVTTYESFCDEDLCNDGPGDTIPGEDGGGESDVLECYTCTMSASTNDSCFTDPDNAGSQPITECKLGAGQCCIISRTDSTDDLGTPVSMFRGCLQDCDPSLIGELITISKDTVTTYESFCDEDLCNDGPGDTIPGGGSDSGSYLDGIDGLENGREELNVASASPGSVQH